MIYRPDLQHKLHNAKQSIQLISFRTSLNVFLQSLIMLHALTASSCGCHAVVFAVAVFAHESRACLQCRVFEAIASVAMPMGRHKRDRSGSKGREWREGRRTRDTSRCRRRKRRSKRTCPDSPCDPQPIRSRSVRHSVSGEEVADSVSCEEVGHSASAAGSDSCQEVPDSEFLEPRTAPRPIRTPLRPQPKSTLARVAGARRRRERSPLPVPDSFDSFSSLSNYLMARAAARPSWTSDKGRGTGKGKSSEQR